MGLLEVMFLVFMTLKLIGVISWSWLVVCIPLIVSAVLYIIAIILHIVVAIKEGWENGKQGNVY